MRERNTLRHLPALSDHPPGAVPAGRVSEIYPVGGRLFYKTEHGALQVDPGGIVRIEASNDSPVILRTDATLECYVQGNNLSLVTPTTRADGSPLQDCDRVMHNVHPVEDHSGAEDTPIISQGVTVSIAPGADQLVEGRSTPRVYDNDKRTFWCWVWNEPETSWNLLWAMYIGGGSASPTNIDGGLF